MDKDKYSLILTTGGRTGPVFVLDIFGDIRRTLMGHMNITDKDGMWRLKDGCIEDMKTGEIRVIPNMPSGIYIANISYSKYMRECRIAFGTGRWPSA